jgi:hypothetical protein
MRTSLPALFKNVHAPTALTALTATIFTKTAKKRPKNHPPPKKSPSREGDFTPKTRRFDSSTHTTERTPNAQASLLSVILSEAEGSRSPSPSSSRSLP